MNDIHFWGIANLYFFLKDGANCAHSQSEDEGTLRISSLLDQAAIGAEYRIEYLYPVTKLGLFARRTFHHENPRGRPKNDILLGEHKHVTRASLEVRGSLVVRCPSPTTETQMFCALLV